MKFARIAALFVFGLVVFGAVQTSANAQATSTASKSAEISAFAGYMPAKLDYGPHSLDGYAAGVAFTVFPKFILAPSLEIRADVADGQDATEKSVLVGPRVQIDIRRKLHPYAEFMIGGAEIIYHPDPYPDYTGDRSKVYAYGGGINIDVSHHFGAKFDFQERSWNLGTNGNLSNQGTYKLYPATVLVGVTYTVPFRIFNRQGDFR